jgi:hypothetical protein
MRVSISISIVVLLSATVAAQTPCVDTNDNCSSVPRFIRFTGSLVDSAGQPRTGVIGVTFSIYSQAVDGVPLWQEVQNVSLGPQGRYSVLLGLTTIEGLPSEIFNSPGPRWLGVWPQLEGEKEHSRVILVSVPYALKAADSETLQGLPASAFLRATSTPSTQTNATSAVSGATAAPSVIINSNASPNASAVTTAGGVVDSVPKFGSATSIVGSQISEVNGVVGMKNLANILFADRFAGGVPEAVEACPAAGCVIYAYSPTTNPNLGTIDPGKKAITIYLGPYNYQVTQITLENDLEIIGMGSGATMLYSTNGNMPPVVVPQHNDGAAQHVRLSGFHIFGAPGNTSQDGILLDASGFYNAGVWYSELDDLILTAFSGDAIHLKGTNNGYEGMSQFTEFNRVIVFRPHGAGNGLRVEGAAYELYFNDCEFDGAGAGDGTNIFLGGRPGNPYGVPIDVNFRGLTSQAAATAVEIDGGWAISFYSPHHEFVWGGYLIQSDLGPVAGVTISGAGFQTSGSNNGAGYLLNVNTSGASGIRFIHNHIMNPADTVVRAVNGANVVYQDNLFVGNTDLPVTSGITKEITSAGIINIGSSHTVGLLASVEPISTIQANLGAGESATFYTIQGPVTFVAGGNIHLMGMNSVVVNGSITFVVSDVGYPSWVPISQWSAPTAYAVEPSRPVIPFEPPGLPIPRKPGLRDQFGEEREEFFFFKPDLRAQPWMTERP